MSQEINSVINVSISLNGQNIGGNLNTLSDLTTAFIGEEQTIATTATQLNFGNVGTSPIFVYVKNLDATNFVQIDSTAAMNKWPQKVLPGRAIYLMPETATLYALANTAACSVFVISAG